MKSLNNLEDLLSPYQKMRKRATFISVAKLLISATVVPLALARMGAPSEIYIASIIVVLGIWGTLVMDKEMFDPLMADDALLRNIAEIKFRDQAAFIRFLNAAKLNGAVKFSEVEDLFASERLTRANLNQLSHLSARELINSAH